MTSSNSKAFAVSAQQNNNQGTGGLILMMSAATIAIFLAGIMPV